MISDFAFILVLSIFLIILYRRHMQNRELYDEKMKDRYIKFNRNNKVREYIKSINIVPEDRQKIIFSDMLVLVIILSIMYLFLSKSIFFAAVVSNSMVPTFNKSDIILLQNIDRRFNVGDIIIFKRPDTSVLITHRVARIEEGYIRTAGDATRQTDWWQLKDSDIVGKAISVQGKPIVIKQLGMYFIAEDKNQKFGPYDYNTLFLIFEVIKLYGYVIAIISIFAYVIIESTRVKKIKKEEKMKKYTMDNFR